MTEKEIFTRKQAAEYIGICLASFAKIQNKIPQIRIGKNVRFFKNDIDIYLKENCYEKPSE